MTQALFSETAKTEETINLEGKRQLNVIGVLKILGDSRNGYYSFKSKSPSEQQLIKVALMEEIRILYDDSYQNYGAPKNHFIIARKR